MTVGFLLNTCEPFYRGGYERRAWSFAREFARRGYDVRIYTSCPRDETIEGVRFVRLAPLRKFFNARGVRNGWADLLFAVATMKLFFRLRQRELDVLDICATPFLHLPFVAAVARWKGIPTVLTCHEALLAALPDYARERGSSGSLRRAVLVRVLAAIYRLGMSLFPRRMAVSTRTAEALRLEGFPAQVTIEFGLEPEAFSLEPPAARAPGKPVRLVSCGRLTPIKSVDQILAALLPLQETVRPFHLDVIGDGSERGALETMVKTAGAEHLVTFHGELPETAKRARLGAGDIFILASPREGFSIATLEAMAQGCAALVVNDPARPNGVLDFVRNGQEGLVVAPGVDAMREGLRHLIESAAEREACRRTAYATSQRFRIDRQVDKWIEACLATRPSPAA